MTPPDPAREIRLVSLRSLRGANLWSPAPVTRIDLAVGEYDEISSAEVPGVTDALMRVLPGLIEHRCSIGERGGFLTRLRRGTYAPHILEHVGLELQAMVGHDVGFGRARGGDRPGEYTVVFEHLHAEVGLRAAALALEIVQRAFAGTLDSIEHVIAELEALVATPDAPALGHHVLCGVTGGGDRAAVRREMVRRGCGESDLIVEVSPAYLLNAGLPYSRSSVAVILDAAPGDVPERYQDPELARKLVSVVADAVPRGGLVVVPAGERELQELIRDTRRRVAVFNADRSGAPCDTRLAYAVALLREGRIVLECCGVTRDGGALHAAAPPEAQLAAALALLVLEEKDLERTEGDDGGAKRPGDQPAGVGGAPVGRG